MSLDFRVPMIKEVSMTKMGLSNVRVMAMALVFGAACTPGPNEKDGIIELEAATGVVLVSPGDLEGLEDKIQLGGNGTSRSYLKIDGKETVKLSGSGSNVVVIETGSTPGAADVRIKGSKGFVDKTLSSVLDMIEVKGAFRHVQLVAETKTYHGFAESQVLSLEEELSKRMTSLGRSTNSFNGSTTIKSAFEKGLRGVRLKHSEEYSTLRITIEGDREFVDGIKSLVEGTKGFGA